MIKKAIFLLTFIFKMSLKSSSISVQLGCRLCQTRNYCNTTFSLIIPWLRCQHQFTKIHGGLIWLKGDLYGLNGVSRLASDIPWIVERANVLNSNSAELDASLLKIAC